MDVTIKLIHSKRFLRGSTLDGRFLISDMHVQNKKYENLIFISRLTGKYATQKLKKIAVPIYGHVYIIFDVPHRHPTYVGALDFDLGLCFVKKNFFC